MRGVANEYCAKKIKGYDKNLIKDDTGLQNPKHKFMWKLVRSCDTLIAQIAAHAQRYQGEFTQPLHGAALPGTARHQDKRVSSGVNLLPKYRFERSVARHGANNRMHGGNFLTGQGLPHPDFQTMDPIELYSLVKAFKHTQHDKALLDYFAPAILQHKKLSVGGDKRIMLGNGIADTTASIEQRRLNGATRRFDQPTGKSYIQNSGGDDGMAVYACSLDGDFYVHLDLADHAGSFQHSSILSGAMVTCAGTIRIVQGTVKILSNNSGHYQPTAADLHDAMVLMQEELGVEPKSVLIACKNKSGQYYLLAGSTLLKLKAGQEIESLATGSGRFRCVLWDAKDESTLPGLKTLMPEKLNKAVDATTDMEQLVTSLTISATK